MSSEGSDIPPDMVQKIAHLELDSITPLRDLLLDEHSASFRWLMASLLAINAGGLIALKDAFAASWLTLTSGIAFFLGIGSSLLIAFLGQRSSRAMMAPISVMIFALTKAVATGAYDLAAIQQQQKTIGELMAKGWKPQAAGWLSFIFFSIGAASLAVQCYQATPIAPLSSQGEHTK